MEPAAESNGAAVRHDIRLIGVYGTDWRRAGGPPSSASSRMAPSLGTFIESFTEQLPTLLAVEEFGPEQLGFPGLEQASALDVRSRISAAELLIFTLPFPADQVVATLIIDFTSPDVSSDGEPARMMLKSAASAAVQIADRKLSEYLDSLCAQVGNMNRQPRPRGQEQILPAQRHQLLCIRHGAGAPEVPTKQVMASILYDTTPPYRSEFITLKEPEGLNQQKKTRAAVSSDASLLYGHSEFVETSVFLTTVQAVGTASRFEQIWQDAYYQVKKFQKEQQHSHSGTQKRGDLEVLADEMGNLELDLAFSVEAAADLGAPVPSYSIATFHDDLYEMMQIRARAATVSQMFVRLGGSIRSELTAIESRERLEEEKRRTEEQARRQQDEERRWRAALAFSGVGFVAIPLTVIAGFFGINADQIEQNRSMFALHYYWWIYLIAGVLALAPLMWFGYVYGDRLWPGYSRWRTRKARMS